MLSRYRNPSREREPEYEQRTGADPGKKFVGNFGQARALPCSPFLTAERTAGGTIGLVDIRSEDGSAQPVSIILVAPRSQGVTPFAELVAVVEFGVSGAETVAIVDFLNGQVINLIASHVRVSAAQQMMRPTAVPGVTIEPTVAAFVTPGWLPHARSPQRTVGSNDVIFPGIGALRGVEVPPFARCMHIICTPNNSQILVQGFSDVPHANLILNVPVVVFPSQEILLPSDLEHVVDPGLGIAMPLLWLQNTLLANVTNWRAIFSLEL